MIPALAPGIRVDFIPNSPSAQVGKLDVRVDCSATFSALPALPRASRKEIGELQAEAEQLQRSFPILREEESIGSKVGSLDLLESPVHRWFYYKEGFSPALPSLLVENLGAGESASVADVFCGVGTTVAALARKSRLASVVGLDVSPFARFVAATKLNAGSLDADSLRLAGDRAIAQSAHSRPVQIPDLHTFQESTLFDRDRLESLIRLRDAVLGATKSRPTEKSFLLLGLAAILEENSSVMRDGRALRRRGTRKRRSVILQPTANAVDGQSVSRMALNQWRGMIDDLDGLGNPTARCQILEGDARSFVSTEPGSGVIEAGSIGLHVFSPPYLNFIDYTEVYKMELWFLGMIENSKDFRAARERTLRSHPSIRFRDRSRKSLSDDILNSLGMTHARRIASFVEEHARRPYDGAIIWEYYLDMAEVLVEVFRSLEPGGRFACVVGNSTFSRREGADRESRVELWSLPVQTDLILASIARSAGFEAVTVWQARELRPRNARSGVAREAILVAQRPKDEI